MRAITVSLVSRPAPERASKTETGTAYAPRGGSGTASEHARRALPLKRRLKVFLMRVSCGAVLVPWENRQLNWVLVERRGKRSMNDLINFGDLTKPADTLIKKVSNAVGGFFAPYQIQRLAKAEAAAAVIEAQSQIEITDLHRRAVRRFIEEEAQYQKNMEDVTAKVLPHLNENAAPDSIKDDWIVNFFDKSRIVSDNEMQDLWARILAGEANAPGTYSQRTVNFLSDLDKAEADLFTKLCGFVLEIAGPVPLVFDVQAKIYNRHGIDFMSLQHLESIGLIKFNNLSGFVRQGLPKKFFLAYGGRRLALEMPKDTDNNLGIGKTLLTRIGTELLPICGTKSVEGFREYVKDQWKEYLPKSETE